MPSSMCNGHFVPKMCRMRLHSRLTRQQTFFGCLDSWPSTRSLPVIYTHTLCCSLSNPSQTLSLLRKRQ
jgi:hypothetical protein